MTIIQQRKRTALEMLGWKQQIEFARGRHQSGYRPMRQAIPPGDIKAYISAARISPGRESEVSSCVSVGAWNIRRPPRRGSMMNDQNMLTQPAIAGELNESGPSEDPRINQARVQGRSSNSRRSNLAKPANSRERSPPPCSTCHALAVSGAYDATPFTGALHSIPNPARQRSARCQQCAGRGRYCARQRRQTLRR
jgi:hypothetical protein